MPKINVVPEFAVIDDEVEISVDGLEPYCPVTIDASIIYYRVIYLGYGHFYADSQGRINLKKDVSYGGTYFGVQPMGLFTSMRPMPSKFATPRLLVRGSADVTLNFEITLWKGHLTQDQAHQLRVKSSTLGTSAPVLDFFDKFFLARRLLKRSYLSPTVSRIPVKVELEDEVVCGVLFLPSGKGPFPGVIDLFGGAGGCVESRAALLAKHGYAALALAYFGYPGLKAQSFMELDITYFDKAIKWFSNHPKVKPGGISMVGVCLGAQMILLSAVRNASVRAAVCINSDMMMATECKIGNPLIENFYGRLDENGKANALGNMQEIWQGLLSANFDNTFKLDRPALTYEHDNPILFMIGEYDNFKKCCYDAIDQLIRSGKKNVFHTVVKGQGHLIEPPYMPVCVASPSPGNVGPTADPYFRLTDSLPYDWNGNINEHGPSQIYAWNLLLDFLRKHSVDTVYSKL